MERENNQTGQRFKLSLCLKVQSRHGWEMCWRMVHCYRATELWCSDATGLVSNSQQRLGLFSRSCHEQGDRGDNNTFSLLGCSLLPSFLTIY